MESGEMVLGVRMEVVDIREREMEVLERTVLVVSWWQCLRWWRQWSLGH